MDVSARLDIRFVSLQEPRPYDKQSFRVCIYEWVPAVDQAIPFTAWPMPEMGHVQETPPPGPEDQELGPMYLPCMLGLGLWFGALVFCPHRHRHRHRLYPHFSSSEASSRCHRRLHTAAIASPRLLL